MTLRVRRLACPGCGGYVLLHESNSASNRWQTLSYACLKNCTDSASHSLFQYIEKEVVVQKRGNLPHVIQKQVEGPTYVDVTNEDQFAAEDLPAFIEAGRQAMEALYEGQNPSMFNARRTGDRIKRLLGELAELREAYDSLLKIYMPEVSA